MGFAIFIENGYNKNMCWLEPIEKFKKKINCV